MNVQMQTLEEVLDTVETMGSVKEVIEYLNDRITGLKDLDELEESLLTMSNEDYVLIEEDTI